MSNQSLFNYLKLPRSENEGACNLTPNVSRDAAEKMWSLSFDCEKHYNGGNSI